jgi:hypothetical protein
VAKKVCADRRVGPISATRDTGEVYLRSRSGRAQVVNEDSYYRAFIEGIEALLIKFLKSNAVLNKQHMMVQARDPNDCEEIILHPFLSRYRSMISENERATLINYHRPMMTSIHFAVANLWQE